MLPWIISADVARAGLAPAAEAETRNVTFAQPNVPAFPDGRRRRILMRFFVVHRACSLVGAALLALGVAACEEGGPTPPIADERPGEVNEASFHLGRPGDVVVARAEVRSRAGRVLEGIGVRFDPHEGHGSVSPVVAVTGSDGVAAAGWTLGEELGAQRLEARVLGFAEVQTTLTAAVYQAPAAFTQLSAGAGELTCGVAGDGGAYCWGRGEEGQLGIGWPDTRAVPVPVAGGHRFQQVAAGWGYACGVTPEGDAYCWGANEVGRLGTGSTDDAPVPAPVAGDLHLVRITAGFRHTCALTGEGEAYCWGAAGRLGSGTDEVSLEPVPVAGDLRFTSISAGRVHTCGVTVDGDAYCWGTGGPWHGTGGVADLPEPARVAGDHVWVSVSAGHEHTCGVADGGAAYCWGISGDGRLGTGVLDAELSPAPVAGGALFSSVSAGGDFTCGVNLEGDGYCWGSGEYGQLGDGSSGEEHREAAPTAVTGELRFREIAAGGRSSEGGHACGVTVDDAVYCWGRGDSGQLGTGASGNVVVEVEPVRVTPDPDG